jgi:hypothetical protein
MVKVPMYICAVPFTALCTKHCMAQATRIDPLSGEYFTIAGVEWKAIPFPGDSSNPMGLLVGEGLFVEGEGADHLYSPEESLVLETAPEIPGDKIIVDRTGFLFYKGLYKNWLPTRENKQGILQIYI